MPVAPISRDGFCISLAQNPIADERERGKKGKRERGKRIKKLPI